MYRYNLFFIAFIISSLIVASISTLTIEIRRGIQSTKQKPFKYTGNFSDIYKNFIYKLRIWPYEFSNYFNLLNDKDEVPEYIKVLYTFLFSFIIALIVYHIFLGFLGYNALYLYWFGNFPMKKKS
tara:strand:- start:401 stop:775 length:375 start_codon:yes stop_codon:yes gene_type:complete